MLKVLLILNLFVISLTLRSTFDPSQSVKALHDVVYELFISRDLLFDVVVFGNLSSKMDTILNNFLQNVEKYQALLITYNKFPNFAINDRSAVIFINLKEIDLSKLTNLHLTNHRELPFGKTSVIYIDDENTNLSVIARNPRVTFNQISLNAYFLVNDKNEIKLKTFEWWTEAACNFTQLVTLNSFGKKTFSWQSPLKIQQKFLNFHGCTLKSYTSVYFLPILDYLRDSQIMYLPPIAPDLFYKREPYELKVLQILSKQGNVSFYRPPIDDPHFSTMTFDDPKIEQDFLFFAALFCGQPRNLECTSSFFSLSLRVMYSPPDSYTTYEKLTLPFDADTWMYLSITFGVAFLSIFLINFLPKVVKDIVYGENVTMPSFNVIRTFFGIGQTRLPNNNFARIVLMGFVLFCLIFRTSYQGVFFTMMTTDMQRSPPKTHLDLRDRNYTLYVIENEGIQRWLNLIWDESKRPRMKKASFTESFDILTKMGDSSSKTAMLVTEHDYRTIKVFKKNTPKLMDQRIEFEPFGLCTYRNAFSFPLLSTTATNLIEGGIVQHFYDYFLKFELIPLKDDAPGPSVFGLNKLGFGFIIWLIACGISSVVFIAEVLWYQMKKLCENLLKYLKHYNTFINKQLCYESEKQNKNDEQ